MEEEGKGEGGGGEEGGGVEERGGGEEGGGGERRGKCGKETHEVSVHCPVLVKNTYVHTTTLCTCMETPVIRDNNHTKTHVYT